MTHWRKQDQFNESDYRYGDDGEDSRIGMVIAIVFAVVFWGSVLTIMHFTFGWP